MLRHPKSRDLLSFLSPDSLSHVHVCLEAAKIVNFYFVVDICQDPLTEIIILPALQDQKYYSTVHVTLTIPCWLMERGLGSSE